MTTPAQIADAVTNSRAKIAAGNGDYLDEVVVALANERDFERHLAEFNAAASVSAHADLQAALALLRRWNPATNDKPADYRPAEQAAEPSAPAGQAWECDQCGETVRHGDARTNDRISRCDYRCPNHAAPQSCDGLLKWRPITESAAPPVTAKLSERLEAIDRWGLAEIAHELETALDAANKELTDARTVYHMAEERIATRDKRIAGLEASAAEDSRARAALEARCAAAEHDAGVWKGRYDQFIGLGRSVG